MNKKVLALPEPVKGSARQTSHFEFEGCDFLSIHRGLSFLTDSQKPAHPPLETLQPIEIPGADLEPSGFLRCHQPFETFLLI
ncbi:MAG: hypothetical protein ACQET7_15415 [Thermodesulfobacteriota bacterium]